MLKFPDHGQMMITVGSLSYTEYYVIIAMIEKLNYCEHFYNVFGMTRFLTVD